MLNESFKTLGVCLNPMIDWKNQCWHLKKKIQMTIRKLMRRYMKVNQAYMCFNAHILTNVFFGCGIANFNDEQIKELRKIHELPMIRKLGL